MASTDSDRGPAPPELPQGASVGAGMAPEPAAPQDFPTTLEAAALPSPTEADRPQPSGASDSGSGTTKEESDTVVDLGDDAGPDKAKGAADAMEAPPPAEKLSFAAAWKKSLEKPHGVTMVDAKPEDFPDGYFGWVVVTACFLIFVWGLGLMYGFGVYQRTYFYGNVFPGATQFQLSWIGSLAMGTQTLIGPFTGRLADTLGQRITCLIGGSFITVGYVLASFSTQLWMLFLTQGLLYGIGAGFCYFSVVTVPAQWFHKHRGLAIGVAVAGGGVGGLLVGPMTQALVDRYGWNWALRITGIVAGGIIFPSALFLKPRFTPIKSKQKFFDLNYFKDYKFCLLYASFFFQQLGFFTPFTFLPSYATNAGMTGTQGSLALGLSNGASAVGRILIGAFADRLGHVNSYTICLSLTPLFVLLIWPFATSFGVLLLFSILYGFFSGGFISLFPTIVATLFGMGNLGARMGATFTATLPGNLAGAPIAGAILTTTAVVLPDGTTHFDYIPLMMYAGFTQLVGSLMIVILRMRATGWKLVKKI
ncbi:major facilitator superfamily domain-containing protein [Hyaloraphidium curvatum]|nr:major facilitator superfamily domain-containing protein [Hyaloraphidium curvatum]